MLHRLFVHASFSNARVWAFLKEVDAAEAQPAAPGSMRTDPEAPHSR